MIINWVTWMVTMGVLGRRGVGKSGQKWPKVGGFLRDGIASGRGVHRK